MSDKVVPLPFMGDIQKRANAVEGLLEIEQLLLQARSIYGEVKSDLGAFPNHRDGSIAKQGLNHAINDVIRAINQIRGSLYVLEKIKCPPEK